MHEYHSHKKECSAFAIFCPVLVDFSAMIFFITAYAISASTSFIARYIAAAGKIKKSLFPFHGLDGFLFHFTIICLHRMIPPVN